MQKKNVLSSPRLLELKKKRRQAALTKFGAVFAGLAVLFALGAYLSRLPGLNISQVEVSGNKVVDAKELKLKVEEVMAGKYFWLFPKTNVLIYPKGAIRHELESRFPRIDEISLSAKHRRTLTVEVSEREAKYMMCGEMPVPEADLSLPDVGRLESGAEETCYFMDEEGRVFDEAPYFSGEVYFKFYGAGGGLNTDSPIGSYFSRDNFPELVSFKDALVSMGLKPARIHVLPNQDVEVYLARGSSAGLGGLGPKIIFKLDSDLRTVAENLQAALATEPLLSGFKNKYSSLLYIDLRFGNKVYFKFNE